MDGRGTGSGLAYRKWAGLQEVVSPVLLAVGDDGQAVRVVAVAADVRVPPGHACRRRRALR